MFHRTQKRDSWSFCAPEVAHRFSATLSLERLPMSVVDDLRKLLQDLVTPELRAQAVKLDQIEKRMDGLDKRLTESIAELRGEMRAQWDATRAEVRSGVAQIAEHLRIDKRLAALEEDRQRKELPEKQ